MRLPVNHAVALAAGPLAVLLLAGGYGGALAKPTAPAVAPTGPAADYPVAIGDPYMIGDTTWTPADQLNYDAVGYAGSSTGLAGIAAAHKTLPLPSYVEVTSLDTGRTILVRLVERGPQANDTLVALSPEAATQLGIVTSGRSAVRVRRVNPPEVERAALRTGDTAPPRMATPEALLKVLRRKLADQSPFAPPPSTPPVMPTSLAGDQPLAAAGKLRVPSSIALPTSAPAAGSKRIAPMPIAAAEIRTAPLPQKSPSSPAPPPPSRSVKGTHVVQVAAFSSRDNADKAAKDLGGQVSPAGRLWRVRLGPFDSSGEASSALEKARAAGYMDARIQRPD